MVESTRILIYNPNSSKSITDGLKSILDPIKDAGIELEYRSGPSSAPESINDAPTSIQSAQAGYEYLVGGGDAKGAAASLASQFSAILVCCFSDHPLVNMLRHTLPANVSVMHLLETGLLAGLTSSRGRPIGIITTGQDMVRDIDAGVAAFFGSSAKANDRYAGCLATGLGVLQLRDPSQKKFVQHAIRAKAATLAKSGVGAVMLGCAGMAGMEEIVRKGLADHLGEQQANQIAIIDTAKAGLHLLTAQIRLNKEFLP
ncbi:uncharacterized protein FA14DRAFT_91691 [Meira miltonrushii]|uniref:DCG1-like protein n=1 Tax=Meira miltonrushii TaxID=1280837 RepID=A0A316V3T5_9BASI|nr:uncharacterized protein FA14DRAFT_91691 [Meira miltonrushii]PWN31658.1 hypothetical protein FA14DRAFT_91691 [Meira miltonrushii]